MNSYEKYINGIQANEYLIREYKKIARENIRGLKFHNELIDYNQLKNKKFSLEVIMLLLKLNKSLLAENNGAFYSFDNNRLYRLDPLSLLALREPIYLSLSLMREEFRLTDNEEYEEMIKC